MLDFISNLLLRTAGQVWLALVHNWPFLLISILVAALLKRWMDADRIADFLKKHSQLGVVAATGAAVATPFCSCGTMAVLLGMMASMMPWAPIVAFMVASPLTSPEELIYSAGLFGWPFALAFFAASILLGLAGGLVASFLESRGWLANQARFTERHSSAVNERAQANSCSPDCSPAPARIPLSTITLAACCPDSAAFQPLAPTVALSPTSCCTAAFPAHAPSSAQTDCSSSSCSTGARRLSDRLSLLKEAAVTGARLLALFLGFAFAGYLLNNLIPAGWVASLFGQGKVYSVPLAATLGLPFYINTEASLPLVRALLEAGMSPGAALAFMISGAGTSIGAIGGALTIARWRVVGLVVAILWAGAIACGLAYDALLVMGLF